MSAIYDNWERLIGAVLKKQQVWQLFHEDSGSPSVLSEASDLSSSFDDPERLGSLSTYQRTSKLVFVLDFSRSIDFEHLHLVSSELLGRGTYGSVYVAKMDTGLGLVVKRLDPEGVSQKEFDRHMAIAGEFNHAKVVPLRAHYSFRDERLLLYDYYPQGSLHSLLHGRNGEPRAEVDWQSRLKIALGAARGIAEIHRHNGGNLVHGNIKSSNVFRNPDQYGCISDLGLTNMIQTTFVPTAHICAPEVKNSQNVSQASDVYSFGILLLELLARKPSVHVPGGPEAVNLVKEVTSIRNRIRAAKVFDPDLLKDPSIKEQMIKMLQVGMKCVEKSRNKRPKISEVVKMLEEISSLYPMSDDDVVENKLAFLENPNPILDLEDILRAPAEVLGKGIFVVKRLTRVLYRDIQKHVYITRRRGHKSVAHVMAYHYCKNERLLVYDCYVEDSLSVALHARYIKGKEISNGSHEVMYIRNLQFSAILHA